MADMNKEEFNQIADEIEQDEELGTEENDLTEEELESFDSDDEFDELDDEEYDDVTRTETITIIKQPIVTSVIVGAEIGTQKDERGNVVPVIRPMCKASIERHLDPDEFGNSEVEIDEFDVIKNDFTELANEVSVQIVALRERMNSRR